MKNSWIPSKLKTKDSRSRFIGWRRRMSNLMAACCPRIWSWRRLTSSFKRISVAGVATRKVMKLWKGWRKG
jgi:hypothetical protein